MAKQIKGYLVDVKNMKAEVVNFEDDLQTIYGLIDVSLIDVAWRKIGENTYDIIVDDEGLLKENPIASAFDYKANPQLVGSLLIVNHDEEGNFSSLTDEQIEELKQHTGFYQLKSDAEGVQRPCIVGVEYC